MPWSYRLASQFIPCDIETGHENTTLNDHIKTYEQMLLLLIFPFSLLN